MERPIGDNCEIDGRPWGTCWSSSVQSQVYANCIVVYEYLSMDMVIVRY
jgi:hypothetical protein